VYAFNVGSKDVTLIDAASHQVRDTRPLGAAVRFLSNEQTYWDGQRVWTYDFPDNRVEAIAIDPKAVSIARTIKDIGTGPAHSVVLLPDKKTAIVNVAGDNLVAFLNLSQGVVDGTLKTGAFPCDFHLTPNGQFGFVPERDQDTVSKVDIAKRQIVKTVKFPPGSKPWMLRVSPDGKEVWVQTGVANSNTVLDADDLSTLATMPIGQQAVTNAWTPDARYSVVMNSGESFTSVFDAKTFKEVKRVEGGQGPTNIGFTRDGRTAFVTVAGANMVAVIDVSRLEVIAQLKVGEQPQGLIVL
jgi:YVTN family beta-propeller protein